MTDIDSLRRLAIIGASLAIVVGIVTNVLTLPTWGFETFTFGDPETVLGAGAEAAILWRWAMLGDMFYSYLLLLPLALFAHRRLRDRKPWLADLGLSGALAYIFLGAASAAILANAGSALIEAYATASAAEQGAIATSYTMLRDAFYFGIWQTLDAITAGTWAFSIGWLLLAERPVLGRLLVVLAGGFWAAAVMTMLDVHSLAVLGAIFLVVLLVWLGWVVLDRRSPIAGRVM